MDREIDIEKAHLAQANHHIAEAEGRLARQKQLIEELTADGHDTTNAKRMLQTLEATLKTMHAHRQLLLREVTAVDTAEPPRSF
ncbi:MAG TPA: hypothetical protein VES89_09325 [Candidatus Competibacteraceae bacterium]|nr:hypothetical protein [Candidatus Competibacteraceae bacterium]